jgi:hypothetical protein
MTDEPKNDPDAPVPLTFERILEAIVSESKERNPTPGLLPWEEIKEAM